MAAASWHRTTSFCGLFPGKPIRSGPESTFVKLLILARRPRETKDALPPFLRRKIFPDEKAVGTILTMGLSDPGLIHSHVQCLWDSLGNVMQRCLNSLRRYAPFVPRKPVHNSTAARTQQQQQQHQHRAALAAKVPRGTWDSHMHVFNRYPVPSTAPYSPGPCTTEDAMVFESTLGIGHIVLVQPSCFGNDNTCMLETLQQLGPSRARAVIMFDPATTPTAQLKKWHAMGVRGVRINLQSVGKTLDTAELRSTLQTYADAVRPLDWVVQIYVPMATLALLEDIVPELDVRVCIDHIGHPTLSDPTAPYHTSRDPYDLPGFASLAALLKAGNTYVKLSGAYRFSQTPGDYADVRPIAAEILKLAGRDRAVFATDWPHTRFEGLDIAPWVDQLIQWCGTDTALVNAVFRDTAMELWGVEKHEEA